MPDRFQEWSESWKRLNPGWTYLFWTDRMLLDFVSEHYPERVRTYCKYHSGVMRADAARYMLLDHFGGIYADVDTECRSSLESLTTETRVVLCHEPPSHWSAHAPYRSHPFLLFNGVMASPAHHPFWGHLIDALPSTAAANDILDATGPCFLTGRYLSFSDKATIAVHSCHLFNSANNRGLDEPDYDMPRAETLAHHYWAGTWTPRNRRPQRKYLRTKLRRWRHSLTKGRKFDAERVKRNFTNEMRDAAPPAGDNIAILVPLRDAAQHVAPLLQRIGELDYPKERIKLVFCEGDSKDATWERLHHLLEPLRSIYRDIVTTQYSVGGNLNAGHRWEPKRQRKRRANIARVRNHLIERGLDETDDWALWIDVDVWSFPRDIIQILRGADARIVTPNCATVPGGLSYDMNSFVSRSDPTKYDYYRHMVDGLFQPPPRTKGRLYLDCLRHTERVRLDGVGGTMLLVDAALHRAGLIFPEQPYKNVIETEAFGFLARDLGIPAIGLPQVEILHVPTS